MTPEGASKLLWDARAAADRIARVVAGIGFPDYLANDIVRWAVERQFIVIGEALAALRRDYPDQAQEIPVLRASSHSAMC